MDDPPPLERIIEAMLFIGGPPLTFARAAEVIRSLSQEQYLAVLAHLTQIYRLQGRPYTIVPREQGHEMALRPDYRTVRERLLGGPRETRLTAAAQETLALIAYRQPISREEIEALRGADSLAALRQLVRLGLVVLGRGEQGAKYSTTTRFLREFGLTSLDDLPRGEETFV
ncbi:MAG: SMC-Scp complex subunit ScpB [Gemmataceae bacterium]